MKYIDHYRICGLLGRGGMGNVLNVEVPVIRRILALKLLAPGELLTHLMGRTSLERLFTEEATVMAAIRHPNVIAVFDYGSYQGSPYYVMDYYGNNLGAVIDPGILGYFADNHYPFMMEVANRTEAVLELVERGIVVPPRDRS